MKALFSVFNVTALLLLLAAVAALQWVQRPAPKPEAPQYVLSERLPVEVPVYYATPEGRLASELRNVPVVQGDQNSQGVAEAAVKLWAQGPASDQLRPLVAEGMPAPRVWLRADNYFVDLPAQYKQLDYSVSGEYLMLCSLTRTLLEGNGLDVTFLVGGKNVTTLGQIDLRQPLTRQDCNTSSVQ